MDVLFVDDEESLLEQAKIYLEKNEDMEVDIFTSVNDAITSLDKKDYDVIVSDYRMPDIDGLDFLEKIREEDNDIPFIIFTGKGREEVAMKALNLGANRYLQKGGDPQSQYGVLSQAIIKEFEHKKRERELKESEKKYRTLFESANDGILIMDEDRFIDCNKKALELYGCDKEELIGKSPADFSPSEQPDGRDSKEKAIEKINNAYEGKIDSFEWLHETKGGELFHSEISLNTTKISQDDYLLAIVRDITERKENEQRLKDSKDKIKELDVIASQLQNCYDKDEVYQKAVETAHKVLEFDVSGILIEEDGKAVVKYSTGPMLKEDERISSIENGIVGLSMKTGDSYLIKDKNNFKSVEPKLKGFKSGITIPIGKRGVFQAISRNMNDFDESDLELAELLISHVSEALERIEGEEELKDKKEKIEKLHEIAVKIEGGETADEVYQIAVNAAEEILDFDICTIDIKEGDKLKVKATSSGAPEKFGYDSEIDEGVGGKTIQNRESYIITDAFEHSKANPKSEDFRSGISVPIGDFGVFQAVSRKKGYFEEEDLKMAQLLISHVTETVNRLRREKDLQENKDKIEELHHVSSKLERCQDKEEVYKTAIDTAEKVLDFDMGRIYEAVDSRLKIKEISSKVPNGGYEDLRIEEGIGGKTYRNSESFLVENMDRVDEAKPAMSAYKSGISVPIGKFGVFQATSFDEYDFGEEDIRMAELLMSNVDENLKRIEHEKSLKESEERYKSFFEDSPIPLWEADFSEVKRYIDSLREETGNNLQEFLEDNPEEIENIIDKIKIIDVNQNALDLFRTDDKVEFIKKIKRAILDNEKEILIEKIYAIANDVEQFQYTTINTSINDTYKAIYVKWSVARGHQDDYSRILISMRDITEWKKASREKKLFSKVVETTLDGVVIIDDNGKIIDLNQGLVDMVNAENKQNMIGENALSFIPTDHEEELDKIIKNVREEGKIKNVEISILTDEGEELPVEFSASLLEDDDHNGYMCIIRDVKERKEAVKDLVDKRRMIERLHDFAVKLEGVHDEKEACELSIKAAEEILGFGLCNIGLREGDKLVSIAHSSEIPEDGVKNMSIDEGITGKTYRSGETIIIEDVEKESDAEPQHPTYESGISIPVEDHGVFQVVSTEKEAFDDTDVELVELLVSHLGEALKRIKSEERENFLHTLMRHDLKNKNQLILGYLELLKDMDIDDKGQEMIDKALNACFESEELLNKIKILREVGEEEKREIDLNSVVKEVVDLKKEEADKKGIDIEYDTIDHIVYGGPLIKELMVNLIDNSIKHSKGTKLEISGEASGDNIFLRFDDDGRGLKEDQKDKIFDKGFKSSESSGFGIGLYIVKKIAESYGGSISVNDSPLGGTRFELKLDRKVDK